MLVWHHVLDFGFFCHGSIDVLDIHWTLSVPFVQILRLPPSKTVPQQILNFTFHFTTQQFLIRLISYICLHSLQLRPPQMNWMDTAPSAQFDLHLIPAPIPTPHPLFKPTALPVSTNELHSVLFHPPNQDLPIWTAQYDANSRISMQILSQLTSLQFSGVLSTIYVLPRHGLDKFQWSLRHPNSISILRRGRRKDKPRSWSRGVVHYIPTQNCLAFINHHS